MKANRFLAIALSIVMIFSLLPYSLALDNTEECWKLMQEVEAMEMQAELQRQQLQAVQQNVDTTYNLIKKERGTLSWLMLSHCISEMLSG